MSASIGTSPDKVIYQYKLLKRIRRRPVASLAYIGALVAVCALLAVVSDLSVIWWTIASIPAWHALYALLTTALLTRDVELSEYKSRYGWIVRFPWIGYLPHTSVPFEQFRFAQLHLLFIGAFVSASLSVWLPKETALMLGFAHLWCMAPRLYIVAVMRRSSRSGSIVHLGASEVDLISP